MTCSLILTSFAHNTKSVVYRLNSAEAKPFGAKHPVMITKRQPKKVKQPVITDAE
jgi:hypothetical protein